MKQETYTKKLVLGFAIIFACSALANIFGYLLRWLFARQFTPEEFGLLYAVMGLFGLIAFLQTLGLTEALLNYIPGAKDKSDIKKAFLSTIYTQLSVTFLIALTAVILAPWLAENYFHHPLALPLIIIYSLSILVSPVEISIHAFLQGMGKHAWYAYLLLARSIALVVFAYVFLSLGFGLVSGVLTYAVSHFVVLIGGLWAMKKLMPEFAKLKAAYDWHTVKRLFKFGYPVMIAGTISVSLSYVDTFFLTLLRPLSDVALYNIALPTAGLIWFVSGVVYTIFFPLSSEMNAKGQIGVLTEGMKQAYLYVLLLVLPASVVFVMFPDLIINALFGSQYLGAAVALQILVLAGVIISMNNLNSSVLAGIGHPGKVTKSLVAAGATNVILSLALIPKYGVEGCAVATFAAFAVLFFMNWRALRKHIKFSMDYSKLIRLVIANIAFAVVLIVLRNTVTLPLWSKVLVVTFVGGIIYFALLFLLRVTSIRELKELRKQVLH